MAATGAVPSGKEVRKLLGVGSGRAARLLAEVGPVPARTNGRPPGPAR